MKKLIITIIILLICKTSFATLKDSSLLMSLKFEDSNGTTTCADASGNNRFGTITGTLNTVRTLGTTTSASVKFGGGILLNGTSDFVGIPSGKVISSGNFTIMIWVYPQATAQTNNRLIFSQGTLTTGSVIYLNEVLNTTKIAFSVDASTGSITSDNSLNLNTWTHLVGVYNSTASPKTRLYVNGILQSGSYSNNAMYSANGARIGQSVFGGAGHFPGIIDEFKIYNRALTQSEIRQEMLGLSLED